MNETKERLLTESYNSDTWTTSTKNKGEFFAILDEIEDGTKTLKINTAATVAVPVEGGGLLLNSMREDAKIPDAVTDESVMETASELGSNLAIVVNGEGILLSPTAADCYVGRLGLTCPAFNKLPTRLRAEWLNTASEELPDKKLFAIVRGEKARGIVSERYQKISQKEIFDTSLTSLRDSFDSADFVEGVIQHDSSRMKIEVDDEELIKGYKEWLSDVGFPGLTSPSIFVSVETSDTTDSSVKLSVQMESDEVSLLLGSPISMAHLRSASIDVWKKKICGIIGHVETLICNVERLGSVKLAYPDTVFKSVGLECGISKKLLASAIEEFHIITSYCTEPTAHDIYYALSKILYENKGSISNQNYVRISENLSRCLHPGFPWADHDTPVVL